MTYGGGGYNDPFGADPFSGGQEAQPGYGPPQNAGYGAPQQPYPPPGGGFGGQWPPGFDPHQSDGKADSLATLSVVFAFVFAPAGAVLGHLALSRINRTHEPGRQRAIVGLVISYVVILLGILALVGWLVTSGGSGSAPSTTTPTAVPHPTPPPRPSTTVITRPPVQRPTVSVPDLRVGDCVEVKQEQRDPNDPATAFVTIYPTACEVRDGVEQVQQILSTSSCRTNTVLDNKEKTIFACIADYKG
jgi:hypothetical protein